MAAVFRKWRFHLSGRSGLLSFFKVPRTWHGIGRQKVAFPSFWALEARVFLQNSTLVFRKWRFHFYGRSRLLSFCKVRSTCHWSSERGVSIFLRRFHLSGRSGLLLFCEIAHAIGLQKLAFPFSGRGTLRSCRSA